MHLPDVLQVGESQSVARREQAVGLASAARKPDVGEHGADMALN